MRKFLLLIAVFSFAALGSVDAQSCAKSKKSCAKTCAKSKAMSKKSTSAEAVDVDAVAAKFASENENIERRVCEKSGKVSYFETSVCQYSGSKKVSEVSWDADNAKFVNVSPSADNAPAKKSCSKSKAACAKGAKASSKGCCAKGTCQKACCAGKKASATEAKAVKASM